MVEYSWLYSAWVLLFILKGKSILIISWVSIKAETFEQYLIVKKKVMHFWSCHQWNTNWQHCDASCKLLPNLICTANYMNFHFLSCWWRNRLVSNSCRIKQKYLHSLKIFSRENISTGWIRRDLARYATELLIWVWLFTSSNICNFLFFNWFLLKLKGNTKFWYGVMNLVYR